MPITLNGDSGITTPTYGGSDTSEYLVPVTGFKNRIINGAMQIDQRNAGASVTPTNNGYFSLDRWRSNQTQSSKFSLQQNAGADTPPMGFTNYLGVTSLSSYSVSSSDYFTIHQRIEGYNIADLAYGTASASEITVSFWVRSSLTGTFGGAVSINNFEYTNTFSYTISSANTWEYKTVSIIGNTAVAPNNTNEAGLTLIFSLGAGATRQQDAGEWQASSAFSPSGCVNLVGTSGATFYITGVQLEKGSTATSFDYRPYGTELALCQRYYYRIGGGTGSSVTATRTTLGIGFTNSTTNTALVVSLPITMRTAATLNWGGTLTVSGSGYAANATDVALLYAEPVSSVSLNITTAVTTAGVPRSGALRTDTVADSFVDFSAEL